MSHENDQANGMTDRAWPGAVEYRLAAPKGSLNETVWRCDTMRAGTVYNRLMFDTKAEAEAFVKRVQQAEPDQIFNVEAIRASTIWN